MNKVATVNSGTITFNLKDGVTMLEACKEVIAELKTHRRISHDIQSASLDATEEDISKLELSMKQDPIVNQVIHKFRKRSEVGIKKYNTTLHENNTDDFLNHLQEELMDAVNYIQKLMANKELMKGHNFINSEGTLVINSYGELFKIGDLVEPTTFKSTPDKIVYFTIQSSKQILAHTETGFADINFIKHV